jgi:hypothetical protein
MLHECELQPCVGSTSPMTISMGDAKEGEDKTNLIVNYIPLMLTEESLRYHPFLHHPYPSIHQHIDMQATRELM